MEGIFDCGGLTDAVCLSHVTTNVYALYCNTQCVVGSNKLNNGRPYSKALIHLLSDGYDLVRAAYRKRLEFQNVHGHIKNKE